MYDLMISIFLAMDDINVSSDDEGWESGVDLAEALEKTWKFQKIHIAKTVYKNQREDVLEKTEDQMTIEFLDYIRTSLWSCVIFFSRCQYLTFHRRHTVGFAHSWDFLFE